MKVLFLHPYKSLGDWNHRLARQVELMRRRCELKVLTERINPVDGISPDFRGKIRKAISDFKPDVVYVNGYVLGSFVVDLFDKVVYDMGSFISRNILIQEKGWNVEEMLGTPDRELLHVLRYSKKGQSYEKEKKVMEKVKAIVSWESKENDLIEKIFKQGKKVKEISPMFSELPEPMPFKEKLNRTIAVAPSWGDREKNGALLNKISKEFKIISIGDGGSWKKFVPHDELMDEINKSKILYCPYTAGGCGTVSDGLRLGCNVVTYEWYPFNTYVNDGLIIKRRQETEALPRAMKEYFLPKKELPSENGQLDRIFEVFKKVAISTNNN